MSEVILVVLQRPEAVIGLLRVAGRLAMLLGGARVSALAMQTPLGLTRLMGDGGIPEEMLAGMQAEERRRVASLKAIFDGWAAMRHEASVSALWSTVEANPNGPVAKRGRRADFLVLPRAMSTSRSLAGMKPLGHAHGMTPEPTTYPGYRFPAEI